MSASNAPCIVGIGKSDLGWLYRHLDPERSDYELALDAFADALDDAGLRRADIDSVVVGRLGSYLRFCADAGLGDLRCVNFQAAAGFQSGLALLQAVAWIQSGQAETVACVYGNNGRSVRVNYGGASIPTSRYDDPYGMTSNGAYYGMLFRRHQHEFGTSADALAEIAIAFREQAGLNPEAIMREPITREDYFASPLIVDPLRLLDYCLINDGGVAYIVTTLERARDLRARPVRVLSSVTQAAMGYFYGTDDCWYGTLRTLSARLFGLAGLAPADLKMAQIYDNFTPAVLFALEGMGFCGQGEGGAWLLEGHHRRGGRLPLNTAGGHLSEGYLQGWAHMVEIVRQLRGEAGERQVPGCDLALDVSCSPVCAAHLLAR